MAASNPEVNNTLAEISLLIESLRKSISDNVDAQRIRLIQAKLNELVTKLKSQLQSVLGQDTVHSHDHSHDHDDHHHHHDHADHSHSHAETGNVIDGVHPKVEHALGHVLPDMNTAEVWSEYQSLKAESADALINSEISVPLIKKKIKTAVLGWLLDKNNIRIHVHSLEQLYAQIFAKHPSLKKLLFSGSDEQMIIVNEAWDELIDWISALFRAWEKVHMKEGH